MKKILVLKEVVINFDEMEVQLGKVQLFLQGIWVATVHGELVKDDKPTYNDTEVYTINEEESY